MDSKHTKVDKNQQMEKLQKCHLHSGFCMLLTMALCQVPLGFAVTPHIYTWFSHFLSRSFKIFT